MKSKYFTKFALAFSAIILIAVVGCKKEGKPSTNNGNTTVKTSKLELITKAWILKETFVDDVAQTTNGSGVYKFSRDGKFSFEQKPGQWYQIGTYWFNDADSTSVSVLLSGTSMSMWWTLNELTEKSLKTEFMASGKKQNYNYVR